MAIAKNFLKFPQAMALQWPLPLGKPRWHTSRPTTRLGRAIRAFISRAVKAAAALPHAERLELAGAVKKTMPSWLKEKKRRAKKLAQKIKKARLELDFSKIKEQIYITNFVPVAFPRLAAFVVEPVMSGSGFAAAANRG